MKIAFLVKSIESEYPRYATTVMAHSAAARDHEIYYITPDDFAFTPDDVLCVHAVKMPNKKSKDTLSFMKTLRSKEVAGSKHTIPVTDLDVIMLRNDPANGSEGDHAWVESTVLVFTQEAARRGVLVLNDPTALSRATNKFYFQLFPEEVRPKTLISRDAVEIKKFIADVGGKAVIKPMQGSGGQSVFLVNSKDGSNINQMIEAVERDGYVVAQKYLPAAADGDIRFFLLNGEPLVCDGKYAAIHRKSGTEDMRSNMHVGGKAKKAKIGADALRLAAIVRPKLIRDGMFLVGLDIAGDKLMEINVFSPGGLFSACETQGADFGATIIQDIERKVAYRTQNPVPFDNATLSTL